MIEKSPPPEFSFLASGEVVCPAAQGKMPPASKWGAIKFAQTRLYARAGFFFKAICQTK
jgi:hypothetical protein